MFTVIIETTGEIVELRKEGGNLHLTIACPLSAELKIDQSVSHNGVCLTVVKVDEGTHTVTAIDETLNKTNLGDLKTGSEVNIERCTQIGSRLDGHIVQGHVDQTGTCIAVAEESGSWIFQFEYEPSAQNIVVEKGSICVNGISLTAFDAVDDSFKVAIIPYTFEHTTIKYIGVGTRVNLEFDIIGKYVARLMEFRR
jgi:riboflavin synthase